MSTCYSTFTGWIDAAAGEWDLTPRRLSIPAWIIEAA
ncbi:Uncharacterised protein [Mycolicibacterium fortuitum]|uniref:Uncharacterized protein n=1 Tax=Mycolicibacterium fortuitum TaxID=1766 RepID=A0A378V2Q0_MYCFO|nr:hypothetical protein CPGR_05630 [Mycolicibacterium fortuitum subsp. fortuitum DSM 46621 = ATCC 6841 = JCM 6387]CRL80756.1 hypothetical protein CPGR_03964 [Mycolicibacter nonchromogenicus]SUA03909.1 Uncharacterised protein [Mycolicibacterium fortuitum]